jgi:NAD-dependent SIR2 family protein deacetylase
VTDAIARQIGARPDVKSVFVNGGRLMGGAVGSAAEVRKATLIINLTPTPADSIADVVINGAAGQVMRQIVEEIKRRPSGCA